MRRQPANDRYTHVPFLFAPTCYADRHNRTVVRLPTRQRAVRYKAFLVNGINGPVGKGANGDHRMPHKDNLFPFRKQPLQNLRPE